MPFKLVRGVPTYVPGGLQTAVQEGEGQEEREVERTLTTGKSQPHTRPRKGGLRPISRHDRVRNYVEQSGSSRLAVLSNDEEVLKCLTGPQRRRANHKTNHAMAPFGDRAKKRTRS